MQEPEETTQIECLQKLNNYISSVHIRSSSDESDSDIDEYDDEDEDLDGDDDDDGPDEEILIDIPLFDTLRSTEGSKDSGQAETEPLGSFILQNEEISENSLFEEIRRTLQRSIEDSLLSFEEYEQDDIDIEEDEDEDEDLREAEEEEEVDRIIFRFGPGSGLVQALTKLEEKAEEKKHIPEVLPSVIDSALRKLWFEKIRTHLQQNREQIENTSPESKSTESNFEGIACGLEMNVLTTCRGTRTIYKSKMISVARDIESKTKAGELFASNFQNCTCKLNQNCDCRRTCICFETSTQ